MPSRMFLSPRPAISNIRPQRHIGIPLVVLAWLGCLPSLRLHAQTADPKPLDAQAAILGAFGEFRVVALGDLHGCQELYDFIFPLIRQPDFPDRARDIVVEFGNALYQDVADRYVSGADVFLDELAKIWRDHTNPIALDSPVYEQFFKTVRDVNATLPPGRRLRVHLGDPPIDWSKTTTNRDWGRMLFQRDPHFASVVERVAFTEGRRTLLIIGGAHLVLGVSKENVTARLEERHPGSMFIVIPHSGFSERNDELEPRITGWKAGSLAWLRGTWLGALPPRYRWRQLRDAKLATANGEPIDAKLEDVADAWLYVGPRDLLTEAMPFPGIYRDVYWNELQRRHLIMWGTPLNASSGDINTSARYYVRPR